MKRALIAPALFGMLTLSACDGDWLGPVERGARAAMLAWDMWQTPAVRPYETPMPDGVEGAIPMQPRPSVAAVGAQIDAMDPAYRAARAALSYRRFCHHCHGPNGDGRIIVGESFDVVPTDLRDEGVQEQTDQDIVDFLTEGSANMIALSPSMTMEQMVFAIRHLRALKDNASETYFKAQHAAPVQ